jgi:hypothetical protein
MVQVSIEFIWPFFDFEGWIALTQGRPMWPCWNCVHLSSHAFFVRSEQTGPPSR